MYSLHDITSVCPKLEPVSDEDECNEEENPSNLSDTFSEEFPVNNNTIHVTVSEYKTAVNGDTSIHERFTTNDVIPYDNTLINQTSDMPSEQTTSTNTSECHTAVSTEMSEGQNMNVYTKFPVYENGGQEALYYPMSAAERPLHTPSGSLEIYANNVEFYERAFPRQNGAPEGLPAYQSSIYGTMAYEPMSSKEEYSPYQALYSGTHRALTAYEVGIPLKPCCNCPCHLPVAASSLVPAFGSRPQRPSVIMVPSKRNGAFWDATSKVESTAHMLMAGNTKLRRDLQQNGFNEMGDSDSSDEDGEGKQEKYFRVNIDGTTARFKLTNEDWERIPINTFPSGGRLLSGDWTRIFLTKVKESNPWCSLRFKNNHVRSENSRKIHSAVFFRGGAECKRPECNVKVRFVIRKEKGKHVDVTYVGNVCHNNQPGGSDVTNDNKRRQVRRTRMPVTLHE